MLQVETQQFGIVEYRPEDAIEFPGGLPAFESEKQFLLIERAETKPVVFLQSMSRRDLCFVTLPVQLLASDYDLVISEEDADLLVSGRGKSLDPGDLTSLAILSVTDSRPTANLLAPVVVNRRTGRGVQAIRLDTQYSHQHPVGALCS